MSILTGLRDRLFGGSSDEEDVHDFLGVVVVDPEYDVIVMPDHVAAMYEVAGTDFAYVSPEEQNSILTAWTRALAGANTSVQCFVTYRPMEWDHPESLLSDLRLQVEATDPTAVQRQRLERFDRDIRSVPMMELHQYFVLRFAMGESTMFREGEDTAFRPLPARWRFWDRPIRLFGGRQAVAEWQRQRSLAADGLAEEEQRFLADIGGQLGRVRRLSAREMANLLHLLWRDDEAYREWIRTDEDLFSIIGGGGLEQQASPSGSEAAA